MTFKDCGELNAWYSGNEWNDYNVLRLCRICCRYISDIEMGTSGGLSGLRNANPVATSDQGGDAKPVTLASGAFNELEDFGIPPDWALFSATYNGPTPVQNPAANVGNDQWPAIMQDQSADMC